MKKSMLIIVLVVASGASFLQGLSVQDYNKICIPASSIVGGTLQSPFKKGELTYFFIPGERESRLKVQQGPRCFVLLSPEKEAYVKQQIKLLKASSSIEDQIKSLEKETSIKVKMVGGPAADAYLAQIRNKEVLLQVLKDLQSTGSKSISDLGAYIPLNQ